jgi:hypothetical protein
MATRIAVSPLSGRIHQGRVNSTGTAFVGKKVAVTSDVLRACVEKAEFHGGTFEIEGGDRKWVVTVREKAMPDERCRYCGRLTEDSYDSPPPDICEVATKEQSA